MSNKQVTYTHFEHCLNFTNYNILPSPWTLYQCSDVTCTH